MSPEHPAADRPGDVQPDQRPTDVQPDQQRPTDVQPGDSRPVRYRRRPRLVPFVVVGALVGLVAGALLGLLGPATQSSSRMQDVVLLGALAATFGGLIASIAYLIADRWSLRRR